ncbi:SAF domain-containing protein [Corynebacterium sp. Marseille-Q2516]
MNDATTAPATNPLSRVRSALATPGWRRMVLARRAAAGLLLALAAITALAAHGHRDPQVTVFARDVAAGTPLDAADLTTQAIPQNLIPPALGAEVPDPAALIGHVTVSAALAGEIVPPARLVSQAPARALLATPADPRPATLVPIPLAATDALPLLTHGDTVTVVTHDDASAEPRIIATGARVVLAGAPAAPGSDSARPQATGTTVLLALPEPEAAVVAAAALHNPLAVIVTGARAQPVG